jgi:hypothetical protein
LKWIADGCELFNLFQNSDGFNWLELKQVLLIIKENQVSLMQAGRDP